MTMLRQRGITETCAIHNRKLRVGLQLNVDGGLPCRFPKLYSMEEDGVMAIVNGVHNAKSMAMREDTAQR